MKRGPNRFSSAARRRPWLWALATLFCISAMLLLYLRANIGFFLDDWYLVLLRHGPGDWLLPYNQHIIILPSAIYQLSLSLFGMNALPLHLVALALFLISVALLFIWMRPLVGEPVSVLGSAVVLFLGAAAGDLVFAFQTGFFGSVVGGLGALIVLRADTKRNDRIACLLLVLSTLFSTLMAPFLVAAGVQLLYRRGGSGPYLSRILRVSWVVLVPLGIYLIWWLGWNQDGAQEASLENALKMPAYILAALGFGGASLTGAFPLRGLVDNYLWVLPGIAIAIGFAGILRRRGKVPPAFVIGLAAGLTFWALCALNYTEARNFYTSRYQYPSVVFLLMMMAGACEGLRPDVRQLKWLCGITVVAVAINTAGLFYGFHHYYKQYEEKNLVNLAALDIAWDTVDPGFRVGLGTDGGGSQVSAADYKAAVARYGNPNPSKSTIAASQENRARLDQLLVGALPVSIEPATGQPHNHGDCQSLTADSDASDTLELHSPNLYINPRQTVLIRLGRFGPGATAIAGATEKRSPINYTIPTDHSNQPWRIGFQGKGKVTLCQLHADQVG